MPKRDERVPAIDPTTPTERRLSALQKRVTHHATEHAQALAERDALLVRLNENGHTHRHLAGLLSYGAQLSDPGEEPLTIACVGRAVRRTRPADAVDGRSRRYRD